MEAPWLAYRQEGPRKAYPKYKRRSRQPWSAKEVKQLRSLAKATTPTGVISLKMERPPASIASKAQREGISLKLVNRSPYNRRKADKRGRRLFITDGLSSSWPHIRLFEAVSANTLAEHAGLRIGSLVVQPTRSG